MRRLSGKCAHLLLRRGNDLETHSVDLVESTEDALKKWDWTTRSSPIFSFEGIKYPNWLDADEAYLTFLGPLDPVGWDIDVPCYATLGTYNLIAVCLPDTTQFSAVQDFLSQNPSIRWEVWKIKCGSIKQVGYAPVVQEAIISPQIRRAKVSHGLVSAEEENSTLFAAAIAKAHRYLPESACELAVFSNAFKEKLENSSGEGDNTKLSWLVNVNAALSRFTSQTFSGVSPIAATESHFWSHSLLGVGMATQALVNIRRFNQVAVGDIDWIDILAELKNCAIPKGWKQLFRRAAADATSWMDAEKLVENALTEMQKTVSGDGYQREERLPLIVCFSGRDGFRSTSFSLSAPLEVISAGNAYGWTPVTLSHEISHVWIHGILSVLFPGPSDVADYRHMSKLVESGESDNVLDDLRLAFFFILKMLEHERQKVPVDGEIEQRHWWELLETHGQQLNEALTHILDYQFFYHQDELSYVKSIWSSWDVIPNIKDRLQSYLIRSACAMLSERISHADAITATLDRLEFLLKELKRELGAANYLDEALTILDGDRRELVEKVRSRELLVRIAKIFFANQPIGARLQREHEETGGVYMGLSPLTFDYRQIQNPMRFLGHFCRDKRGDRAKALWLMAKVAFMQDPYETFA